MECFGIGEGVDLVRGVVWRESVLSPRTMARSENIDRNHSTAVVSMCVTRGNVNSGDCGKLVVWRRVKIIQLCYNEQFPSGK